MSSQSTRSDEAELTLASARQEQRARAPPRGEPDRDPQKFGGPRAARQAPAAGGVRLPMATYNRSN